MASWTNYAPLWVKSHYSFLEGASYPEELVEQAHALGLPALALTDRDGVYGLVRAHLRARELDLPLIAGAEVSVEHEGAIRHLILLAESREGYGALCQLLSRGRLRSPKGQSRVFLDEVITARGGLIALSPSPELLYELRDPFAGSLFAIVRRQLREDDVPAERAIRETASRLDIPTVAAIEVLYHEPSRRDLGDVLTCLRHGVTLSTAGRILPQNAEHALLPTALFAARYEDDPASIARTIEIAERCRFRLSEIRYRYPSDTIPGNLDKSAWLRTLTCKGATQRYPDGVPKRVAEQIERELEVIEELDYGGYFLSMHEIVQFCRSQEILCQGRGSAANSAVCYCLGITAIDPVRMDLLFERFLSRERAEPPDIDLDIEHERREEVIQHVYERYGRRHAAMVANVIRYRARSALRDVGKVLGVPASDIDGLARMCGYHADTLSSETLPLVAIDPEATLIRQWLRLTREIVGFPRHLSIHPGGFLLGHEPVDTIVPIERATMEGRTVIQWDKQDIDDLGLFKVDLLGLGCLTAIHGAFDLLREHEGMALEIATVPAEDPATYAMCSAGDTVGVFQIESRAQMAMLPRVQPRTFYDLVVEVAIVRPGPIQGDMVHPYLRRRAGREAVRYPHPSLERVLQKTLGVPIFQEQVMKLAVLVAGYTPGEADQLRRDMAAWRSKGRIEQHRERLIGGMTSEGIPLAFAERVFQQIQGFGEYGFPESHAASFALLAYVTAWLKCHHPAAFTCAMLNAQPMGFYSPSTLVEDAKRHGVEVRPIDVQHSRWQCTLEPASTLAEESHPTARAQGSPNRLGETAIEWHRARARGRMMRMPIDETMPQRWAIRMGLRYVQGLGERERQRLREHPGPWPNESSRGLELFVRTVRLSQKSLVALAEAGAFDSLVPSRRDALWQVRALAAFARDRLPLSPASDDAHFDPLSRGEAIGWDYRSSQHSTRGHPMSFYRQLLYARRMPTAAEVEAMPNGAYLDYIGMVITRQRPDTATGVTFYTLEDETGFVNVVVWKPIFDRHIVLAKTAHLLGVRGRLQIADRVAHLIAKSLYAPDFEPTDTPKSRDFR